MKFLLYVGYAFIFLLLVKGAFLYFIHSGAHCQRTTLSKTESPSRRMQAIIVEESCTDGAIQTSVADTLSLVSNGNVVSPRDAVFTVEEYDPPETRSSVLWISDKKIQITAPSHSYVTMERQEHLGVEISIVFR